MIGDYRLDPPDDPPFETCPDCEGNGLEFDVDGIALQCSACEGDGERYLSWDEVRERTADAATDRAEARRDDW
jgi:DnaJ-class molecular chaperone